MPLMLDMILQNHSLAVMLGIKTVPDQAVTLSFKVKMIMPDDRNMSLWLHKMLKRTNVHGG